MTGIIDYGCGNLFSLKSSLRRLGENVRLIARKEDLAACDRMILPGVGAFGNAARILKQCGMDYAIIEWSRKGMPLLGICLGMQLLFDKSYEFGEYNGLSLLHGEVAPLSAEAAVVAANLKIPHIGWNSLRFPCKSKLFRNVGEGEYVYFVHSYHAKHCNENLLATVTYGEEICAAAGKGNVFGTQFHPEKSGDTGMRILEAFLEI